jgi:N-acetylneuraminate synthase
MPALKMRNGRLVDEDSAPYITAEINTGHFGKIDLAVEAIRAAKGAGCDCIKFQSWKPESLFTERYLATNRIERRMYDRLSLDASQLRDLSDECASVGLDFSSTPYSFAEVDELVAMKNVPYIKIASMEINNPEFLRYVGVAGAPIVLSTGMSDIDEIRAAVSVILSTGNAQLAVLHCTSVYPTADNELNLNNILMLRREFPELVVGFSDHSLGDVAPAVAVGLGARFLEKHFTLDKSRPGFDNAMAMMPDELAKYVEVAHAALGMLGSDSRKVSDDELAQRSVMRRSIYAAGEMPAGLVITREMLQFKRPGTGLSPVLASELIGKKLVRSVVEGETLQLSDVKDV